MTRRPPWWALALLAAWGACAVVEPPPGGPEDRTPPMLLDSEPDSLAVVGELRGPVSLRFTERISETGVEEAVSVSPRTSPVLIDRGLSSIRVSLRGGWERGRIYHVSVGRGVRDLFNNQLVEPISVVFSTGPAIPATVFAGTILDLVTGRPAQDVRVEAILAPDSLVYTIPTDSAGAFRIAHLPTGSYLVRGYTDVNRNRELDDFEARDTARLELAGDAPATLDLAMVAPDSTPPRLADAEVADSARVELRFDDYLDPAQELPPTAVQIADTAGGVVVGVARVAHGPAAGGEARRDTAQAGAPRPSQTLLVELAPGARLRPGATYRVRALGVRNLVGLAGDSDTELEVARTPAPAGAAPPPQD